MPAQVRRLLVSYARQDGEFALRLAKDLRKAGAAIWIDQLDIRPGQRWDEAIQSALRECTGLIVVLSPVSVESPNVMDEVSYALEARKQVVPILHLPCEIPFRLGRVQRIDFTAQYDAALDSLLKAIGFFEEPVTPHPPAYPDRRPMFWGGGLIGALSGALLGWIVGELMVALPWKSSVDWRTFDYGDPIILMVVAIAIAGGISGTDARAVVFAIVGLGVGFLLFAFLNAMLFIVEEGIVLLAFGALIGAVVGRRKARVGY